MFKVNGLPLLADDLTVLQELRDQLAANGIQRFADIKVGVDNIQFTCPIHNDGQEKRPSCGILTRDKKGAPAGTVHCFTCGYTATLPEMISHCFGRDDLGLFGTDWLAKNFVSVSVENRKPLKLDMSRGQAINKSYVSESELDGYRYYHPYMYQRKLTDEVIEMFDVGYDEDFKLGDKSIKCVTFPVRDITGNTLFVARRCVDYKLFHYPENVDKPVYGVYELNQLPQVPSEVYVVESMINALTCYVYGKPAVALLGLGTERQYEQLRQLPCRKLIIALDGDKAGQRATEKLKKALYKSKVVTSVIVPQGKDINDLTKEEFDELEEVF